MSDHLEGRPVSDGTYTRHGCRCQGCRDAHAAKMQQWKMRRPNGAIPDHIKHGTKSTYVNWDCRCVPCGDANAAYWREYRVRRRAGAT